jgi:hypothetical protein
LTCKWPLAVEFIMWTNKQLLLLIIIIIIILSLLRYCKLSYFLLCMCCLFLHSCSLWKLDGVSAHPKATAYTQNNTNTEKTYTIQASMPWVGIEPTIPVFRRTKTVHALDRAAIVIGPVKWKVFYLKIKGCLQGLILKWCSRKHLWSIPLIHYWDTYLPQTTKWNAKNCQSGQPPPDRALNPVSPEYETGMLFIASWLIKRNVK